MWGSDGDVLEADVEVGGCCSEGGGGVVDDVDILGEAAEVGVEYWFSILFCKKNGVKILLIYLSITTQN